MAMMKALSQQAAAAKAKSAATATRDIYRYSEICHGNSCLHEKHCLPAPKGQW